MNTLLQDLRYGFRMLLKQKGLSAVAPREFSVGSYSGNSNTDGETGLRTMTSFAYQSW